MKLVFGDLKSINYVKEKKRRVSPLFYRYLSSCCNSTVKSTCEIERPIKQQAGVTLITVCNKCNKECERKEIPVY